MARISKQAQIDFLTKQVAWYEVILKEMAGWEFPQGGRDNQDWALSAGRVASYTAQEALDGKSWKTGVPDFKDFKSPSETPSE